MTDTGQGSHRREINRAWSQSDRHGQMKVGGRGKKSQAVPLTGGWLFISMWWQSSWPFSCLALPAFQFFCGLYCKHCLWTITHECTQAGPHRWRWYCKPAGRRISGLKCTGGKGTPNTALTVRRQWLLINQSWQGLSGLLPDQTLMVKTGSCID